MLFGHETETDKPVILNNQMFSEGRNRSHELTRSMLVSFNTQQTSVDALWMLNTTYSYDYHSIETTTAVLNLFAIECNGSGTFDTCTVAGYIHTFASQNSPCQQSPDLLASGRGAAHVLLSLIHI